MQIMCKQWCCTGTSHCMCVLQPPLIPTPSDLNSEVCPCPCYQLISFYDVHCGVGDAENVVKYVLCATWLSYQTLYIQLLSLATEFSTKTCAIAVSRSSEFFRIPSKSGITQCLELAKGFGFW